jgi:hypothetical protein
MAEDREQLLAGLEADLGRLRRARKSAVECQFDDLLDEIDALIRKSRALLELIEETARDPPP